jgi:mRNA interferase RelE/StbE
MSTLTTSKKTNRQLANKPHKYRLQFLPEALKEWEGLDGSVKQPLKKLLEKRLDNPHLPGAGLTRDLPGCYKIKLLKQGVRLVYRVADDALIVLVLAVDRREEGAAYLSAIERLASAITILGKRPKSTGTPNPSST